MDIERITTHDISPGDIIVLTIDTGKMPPQRAKQYMEQAKENIQSVIGTDYRIIVKQPSTQIEIIRTPNNDLAVRPGEPASLADDFERAKPIE